MNTSLFSATGRIIPPEGFVSSVVEEDKNFSLPQITEVDYKDRLGRMELYLPEYEFPSLGEFQDRCGEQKEKALQCPQIGQNAFNRCHLSLAMPHIPELADQSQLGSVLEVLLEGVERVYENEFSDRAFYNYRKGNLAGAVSVVPGTRQDQILAELAKAPQAGILLPNPLQGYSIEGDREIIPWFPDFVSLAGIAFVLALISDLDILAFGWKATGQDLSSLSWQSANSLLFRACDDGLVFGFTGYLASAYAFYSGGLLFLG